MNLSIEQLVALSCTPEDLESKSKISLLATKKLSNPNMDIHRFNTVIDSMVNSGYIERRNQKYRITKEGKDLYSKELENLNILSLLLR